VFKNYFRIIVLAAGLGNWGFRLSAGQKSFFLVFLGFFVSPA
jgi:hypothetical protein